MARCSSRGWGPFLFERWSNPRCQENSRLSNAFLSKRKNRTKG